VDACQSCLSGQPRDSYRTFGGACREFLSPSPRLSLPFFFDPNFFARVQPIDLPGREAPDDRAERWDRANVHAFQGTYGNYLLSKAGKVFPQLRQTVL
jgi:isopenicillin N synthase-like dioxygenase